MTAPDDIFAYNRLCAEWRDHPPPLPNFIGVGSARCGTTSLFFYLRDHPDVFMSHEKEINYFGYRTRLALGPERGMPIDLYRMYFVGHRGQRMIGEISPIYLTQAGAAAQIHKMLGADCKIIAFIRNPAERFLSQFLHFGQFLNGISAEEYVAAALALLSDQSHTSRWDAPDRNLRGSFYHSDLNRYFNIFGKDQVLVIEFTELNDPARLAGRVCEFLGVAPFDAPIAASNRARGSIELSDEARSKLAAVFSRDIDLTARLIGRDLSHWGSR